MRKGFTLMELLVVVLIIGILAAVALPKYQRIIYKAQLMESIQMSEKVREAQEMYFLANGSYATDLTLLDIDFPGCELKDVTYHKGTWLCKNFMLVGNYGWRGVVYTLFCPGRLKQECSNVEGKSPILFTHSLYLLHARENEDKGGTRECGGGTDPHLCKILMKDVL